MKRLVMLTLILNLVPATAQAQPSPSKRTHYFLIVNTHSRDITAHGAPELDEGYAIRRLRRQFPSANFASVRATSNKDLRRELEAYRKNDILLDGMLVLSHGSSGGSGWPGSNATGQIPKEPYYFSRIQSQTDEVDVDLVNEGSVHSVFGPILSNWAPGAKILFTGCAPIAIGSESEKKIIMRRIAQNFQLTDGAIYMNETDSHLPFRQTFGQPFYTQPSLLAKTVNLVLQGASPAMVPVGILLQGVSNRGYTYKIKPGVGDQIFVDHYLNAEANAEATGERRSSPKAR
jgi:hypothetical protein